MTIVTFFCIRPHVLKKLPPKVSAQPLDGGFLSGLKGQNISAQGKRAKRLPPWVMHPKVTLALKGQNNFS